MRVRAPGESGVPTGSARIQTTVPGALRVRGTTEAGIPTGLAVIRTTVPGALRVIGSTESGVPTGSARIRTTIPNALQIIATIESGVPTGTAQIRTALPSGLTIRGSVESGIPTGTARVRRRIPRAKRLRGTSVSGVPTGLAYVRKELPGAIRLTATLESGTPRGSAVIRISVLPHIIGVQRSGVPIGRARIRNIDPPTTIEYTPLAAKTVDITAFRITMTNSIRQVIVLTPVQAESAVLTVWWSDQVKQWFFDLATESGEPIINGRGMIQRTFLVRAFSPLFEGDLYITGPGSGEPPARMDWSESSPYQLHYVPVDTVDSLREQFPWL